MLDEPVGERAGGEGLAGAGGHLDEGARLRFGEGLLEAADGFDAADADVLAVVGMLEGHLGEATAEGVGFFEPLRERFGTVKGEDAARARMRIAFVAEVGFDAGGLVEEGKLAGERAAKKVGQVLRILAGLIGDALKASRLLSWLR